MESNTARSKNIHINKNVQNDDVKIKKDILIKVVNNKQFYELNKKNRLETIKDHAVNRGKHDQQYYEKHKKRILENRKNYHISNRDKILETKKLYYEKIKETISTKCSVTIANKIKKKYSKSVQKNYKMLLLNKEKYIKNLLLKIND